MSLTYGDKLCVPHDDLQHAKRIQLLACVTSQSGCDLWTNAACSTWPVIIIRPANASFRERALHHAALIGYKEALSTREDYVMIDKFWRRWRSVITKQNSPLPHNCFLFLHILAWLELAGGINV